ncbi:hypothetical protein [Brenneria goodwinii]
MVRLFRYTLCRFSHADPNKVSAAYNHAQYVEQRRRMMQEWADRLDRWAANGAGEVNYGVAKISVLDNTLKAMADGRMLPGEGIPFLREFILQ